MIQFTPWPEMLAWPYLMLNGWLPYRDIAIAHTPLLLIVTTLWYGLFGVGLVQLQFLTWTIFAATALLFAATFRSWRTIIVYALLWLAYGGNGLWFDLALAPLAVLLYIALIQNRLFLSGVVFATMLLTKQTAIWFFIPLLFYPNLVFSRKFVLGMSTTLASFFLVLGSLGILDDFSKWAISFGIFTLPGSPGQVQIPTVKQFLVSIVPFVILLSTKINKSLIPWIIAGSMGVIPRWELFHFQPALPFLAMGLSRSRLTTAVVAGFSLMLIARTQTGGAQIRFFEPEFLRVVEEIKSRVKPEARIYALNTWDHIYALTDTIPASRPLVPHLPWYMEQPGIQEEIISDLNSSPPELIVVRDYDPSGLGSYRPAKLDGFIQDSFKPAFRLGSYQFLEPRVK